jgi:CheY-like chemotaxis protein
MASNPTIEGVLISQLESWKFDSTSCQNPEVALDILLEGSEAGQPFWMAILDTTIGTEEIFRLARRIKSESPLSPIHLIGLTSALHHEDLGQAGFTSWIRKPYRKSKLYDVIAEVATDGRKCEEVEGEKCSPQSDLAFKGHRILAAEDNTVNQELVRVILEGLGCRVHAVASGLEAVEAFRREDYDLILMDCQMPGMDGFEATKKIRELEEILRSKKGREGIPIVALTAHAMRGDRERCLAAGMVDYISKPFKREQLVSVLRRWIDKPRTSKTTLPRIEPASPQEEDLTAEDSQILPEATTQADFPTRDGGESVG